MQRRQFMSLIGTGALGVTGLSGCAIPVISGNSNNAKVVVIGGGYGGATAAKYLRKFSEGQIDVTLVEPNPQFISCPMSNLVIGGVKQLSEITLSYDNLASRHGVNVVQDSVSAIDPTKREVRLASGNTLPYDRLIVSPGIDFMFEELPGLQQAEAQKTILHAWKAGPQTVALRKQLESMKDGGVYAISIPMAPYRCPPGPYERACLVANYLKHNKPKSKVLILDANDDVVSKGALFKKAWKDRYGEMIEYRNKFNAVDVDAATRTLKFDVQDDVQADVLNVLPPMRAGKIAVDTGLATANKRWCEVDYLTFESKAAPNIHVIGDAIQIAPLMPKSAHMANQHGKAVAAAVTALLSEQELNPLPLYNNTCYSFVSDSDAIHVSSVHRYDAEKKTMLTVPGSGGVSMAASELEGRYAKSWADNIWADSFA
jgi:sulfide dehydrogenase [flavocytochrome c] flavoprotein chain